MRALRIKNWLVYFENNRTRELKKLDWVPIPNKMDGDGYTELVTHNSGAAHFGAWVAIVEVASKCDPRGTLLRDGGNPHDSASLSRMTRIAQAVFEIAIPRLVNIGWLELLTIEEPVVTSNPAPSCGETAPSCGKAPMEGKGREGNRREENEECSEADVPPSPPNDLSAVAYPSFPVVASKRSSVRTWLLTDSQIGEWVQTFPGIDVVAECRRSHGWIKANMARRKTSDGMTRFVFSWLARAQNRSRSSAGVAVDDDSELLSKLQKIEADNERKRSNRNVQVG